jgi:hypothetical protein
MARGVTGREWDGVALDPLPADAVSIPELIESADLRAHDWKAIQFLGGLQLAYAMIALIVLVLVLIALFAWLTYPGVRGTAQVRESWFSEIKDLIQLLVVSLLVPILATLLGYVFGRHEPN